MTMQLLDQIASGAADLYIRAVCLIIGPVIGVAVFAIAWIARPRSEPPL